MRISSMFERIRSKVGIACAILLPYFHGTELHIRKGLVMIADAEQVRPVFLLDKTETTDKVRLNRLNF